MAIWKRLPQECDSDYFFSGRASMTQGVQALLSPAEIAFIVADLQAFVRESSGIDYLQVYASDDGHRVWCIDALSQSMKDSGDYAPEELAEYDRWTMLLPEEH